jgi:hypothetical protein
VCVHECTQVHLKMAWQFYLFVCLFVYLFIYVCAPMHTSASENGLLESALLPPSFHHVDSRDGAQVIRPGNRDFYLVSHLTGPT